MNEYKISQSAMDVSKSDFRPEDFHGLMVSSRSPVFANTKVRAKRRKRVIQVRCANI